MNKERKPMFDLSAAYYPFEDLNESLVRIFREKSLGGPVGASVLDVGCGRCLLGEHLTSMGYVVSGVELNDEAASIARTRIAEVFSLDINDRDEIEKILGGRKFDYIVFADVLEHLPDPLSALKFYRQFLGENGRLVISLPNVGVWYVRLRLLFGRFDYSDSGVMDRTHLKFFTFRTAKILLSEAGFTVEEVGYAPGIARAFIPTIMRLFFPAPGEKENSDPSAILKSPAYRFYSRFLEPVETFICGLAKGLLAFRIVMVAGIDKDAG